MTGGNPATAFKYDNEVQPGLLFTGRGQLAMANGDPPFFRNGINPNTGLPDANYNSFTGYPFGYDFSGSNGSQFFVTTSQPRFLDFKHTIFGQMVRGWQTLTDLNNVTTTTNPSGENSLPTQDITITSATVEADDHDAVLMLGAIGSVPGPSGATITVTADDGHGHATTPLTFVVTADADGTNDPPLIVGSAPQVVPQETQLSIPLQVVDLEHDYLFYQHFLLDNGARSTTSGPVAAVLGDAGFSGGVRLGVDGRGRAATGSGDAGVSGCGDR
jgi:hypothetical protein